MGTGLDSGPFLSPSCKAASDTLAVFGSDCSAGKLEDSWTSSVEWVSVESDWSAMELSDVLNDNTEKPPPKKQKCQKGSSHLEKM